MTDQASSLLVSSPAVLHVAPDDYMAATACT